MKNIGIVGLGLIGGSLGKVLREKYPTSNIIAYNKNEEELILAYKEKVINNYSTMDLNIFKNSEIIFICTPVDSIINYAKKLSRIVNKNCIITDVGSTKNSIMNELNNFDINFIGGHPMAGSEKTGYKFSSSHLFENAYYILTPSNFSNENDFLKLEALVKNIGAIPLKLNPDEHDFTVATISHVPHVIASALVNCVNNTDNNNKTMHLLAAGGFKDITRIASAEPSIWSSICIDNKLKILEVLESFKSEIENFEGFLNNSINNNVYDFFNSAKNYRDSFSTTNREGYFKLYEFKVDVIDKPGIIATVSTMLSVNSINIKNIGIINNREFQNGVLTISFENLKDMENAKKLLEDMNFKIYN